jgi:hypothetical protein
MMPLSPEIVILLTSRYLYRQNSNGQQWLLWLSKWAGAL